MAFQDSDLLLVNRSSASYKADVASLKSYLAASGVGANVTASDAPPGSPTAGDIWWNSTDGNLYLYYQDADSSQWVPAFSVGAAGGGVGFSVHPTIGAITKKNKNQYAVPI